MQQLKGMKALVTGGAQGIGAGICKGLAMAGATVAVVDQQADKAAEVAANIISTGGTAISITADLSSKTACNQVVAQAVSELGGLDILINNAAPGRDKTMLEKLSDADWDIHQQVVLTATVTLIDAASDYLASCGHGSIINISSVTGTNVAIDQCSWPYHASKAGLDQLTRWLAVRFGNQGIRVNAIAPGLINRESHIKSNDDPAYRAVIDSVIPLKRAGNYQDIAQVVVFLCSQQSSYITGQTLVVDGGLSLHQVFSASLRTFKAATS